MLKTLQSLKIQNLAGRVGIYRDAHLDKWPRFLDPEIIAKPDW